MAAQSEAAPLPGGRSGPPRRESDPSISIFALIHFSISIISVHIFLPSRKSLSLSKHYIHLKRTFTIVQNHLFPVCHFHPSLFCVYISCQTKYTLLRPAYRSHRPHFYGTDLFVLLQACSSPGSLVAVSCCLFFCSQSILSGRQLLGICVLARLVPSPKSQVLSRCCQTAVAPGLLVLPAVFSTQDAFCQLLLFFHSSNTHAVQTRSVGVRYLGFL